jgi:hypothetical protein
MIFNISYIVVLHFFGQVTKDTLSQHILLHNNWKPEYKLTGLHKP